MEDIANTQNPDPSLINILLVLNPKTNKIEAVKTIDDKPVLKNRVDESIENPALGQLKVSNELRKKGFIVSPGGVRSIWLRHDLHTFKLRLKALVQENIVKVKHQCRRF
ncbi:hypothetical protein IX38_13030 [Chryseobacterium luteum]|uniref:Transposase n=1 Tax=Chryseobacterium luteum TaxID=421531 RepID=A0A085ZDL4_9FLAO|nr:hypothetical protein IX38_13030 [Chryseobacterium luteum]